MSKHTLHDVKMTLDPNGTSLQGYLNTSYKSLVAVFGEPNCEGDGYKVDAEWIGSINGKTFTIYNYKDGRNYMGKEGLATTKITDWHIGGNDKQTAVELVEYFEGHTKEIRGHE